MHGADATHFNRPTYIGWLPDGTFSSDGYIGTRVAKFDKNGKFVMEWGKKGTPPNEKRPGYFNNVHGVAVDPQTRRVFVNDRKIIAFRCSTRTASICPSGASAPAFRLT